MPDFMIPYRLSISFCEMNIEIVRFTKVASEQPWIINSHAHENYEFHYIIDGKGTVTMEGSTFEIQKGEFYISAPFVKHEQKTNLESPMQEFCIECKIDFEGNADDVSPEMKKYKMITDLIGYRSYKDIKKIGECFYGIESIAKKNVFGTYTKIQLLSVQIITDCLGIVYEESSKIPNVMMNSINKQRITAIKNFIDANISESISLKDVAKEFNYSERHINRLIIAEYSCSFYQYVMKIRGEVAVRLLKNTNIPVEQVAVEAGFTNYRQMLRFFDKNNIGKPSEIRETR